MIPEAVFIPGSFPLHTYVSQKDGEFERQLDGAIRQPGKIISIVGASKTGKTTLCEKRFNQHRVVVPGSRIKRAEDLWFQACEQAGGIVTNKSFELNPVDMAIGELIKKQIPLVIDDFHYVDREVQKQIARQIKNGAYEGLVVVVLNLPHRSDDPIRANSDLAGRVYSIDLGFWSERDLRKIADVGFPKVDAVPEEDLLAWLPSEALTSPQIMHTLCLEACRVAGISGKQPARKIALSDINPKQVIKNAARSYGSQTILTQLRQGPARRGQARKKFKFKTGGQGDVYELLVRAITQDPPKLILTYDDIRDRAKQVAPSSSPNLVVAMEQWNGMFKDSDPKPLEWDGGQRKLSIIDPHAYFWIREEMHRDADR